MQKMYYAYVNAYVNALCFASNLHEINEFSNNFGLEQAQISYTLHAQYTSCVQDWAATRTCHLRRTVLYFILTTLVGAHGDWRDRRSSVRPEP